MWAKGLMVHIIILGLILFQCGIATAAASAIPLSLPGCPEKCGNVSIPYPFGIGSGCSANSSFTLICQNTTTPYLSSIAMEALNISVYGTVIVKQPVAPINCSDQQRTEALLGSLKGTPFTISPEHNSLVVLGCKNSVWLRANKTTTTGGCTPMCDDSSIERSCNGVNCCQTTIPPHSKELLYTYQSVHDSNGSDSFCGYVFPVDKKWFQEEYYRMFSDPSKPFDGKSWFSPVVLEWEFSEGVAFDDKYCSIGKSYIDQESNYVSSTTYCSCLRGFQGNPYVDEGCIDIDECNTTKLNHCRSDEICINTQGHFNCLSLNHNMDRLFNIFGSVFFALVLLIVAWMLPKAVKKRIKDNRRHNFFKRNGGLLLQQQLSSTDNGLEKTKLFSAKELEQATDHYNINRVLGRGGQGTVYKGMLTDGKIVAIKKSKRVDKCDLEVFINEVVILSQINHRNVVKLLGCCLETEVPLLVYEFIPNGTLFQHIHNPNEDFPLSWEMRLQIAREVAGALAYLHSAASAPIYHRDIKSTNILLDEKYRAKVSDFGTSRSVSIDQTHLTTRVLGTFGYMDPEYFQSSIFTEKSDVYSFGVVIVELLTGEKAISSIRVEEGRSLATHFLHSMEGNQLFDIVDARVVKEGKREEIAVIAELARRCLHFNGKQRPMMKEVAVELEGIQMAKQGSVCLQNQDDNRECHFVESDDFSSILGR